MKRVTFVVSSVASMLVAIAGLPVAHADLREDFMLYPVGQFELKNNETHLLANQKTEKEYRICVENAHNNVPLKVIYDGKESTVAVGNCADFEAMNIRIAPAAKLEPDMVIVGRYHRVING